MKIDYPYIIFIIILLYLTYKSWNRDLNNRYFKTAVFVTFAFIALRACVVGADTYNYTMGFLEKKDVYNGDEIEPLYLFYTKFLRNIMKNEVFFIVCNTFFSLFILLKFIKRYSLNKTLSILLFFLLNIFQPYFIALRQILAIAILFCGVYYVIECRKRKWIVFSVFAIAAYYMHHSTLICSILYVATYFINISNRKVILWTIVITAIFGIFFQFFDIKDFFNLYLNFDTNERLDTFVQPDQLNNLSNVQGYIWLLRYTWVGLFVFYFMDNENLNHWFSKLYLLSIIIMNIFYNVDLIVRMVLPFNIFSIIVFTWAFGKRYRFDKKNKKFVNILAFIFILYFTQAYIRDNTDWDPNSASRMHPYYFFFENYKNHPSITKFN